jgi:hypothetical protein
VVQLVGHLTVNEDGVGLSPTAPSQPTSFLMCETPNVLLVVSYVSNQGFSTKKLGPIWVLHFYHVRLTSAYSSGIRLLEID